jgi:signal transduction histidine kinase
VRIERWLTVAGFGTWLVSGLPTFIDIASGDARALTIRVWAIAFPLFGVAFGAMCLERPGFWHLQPVRRVLLALQAAAGVAMVTTGVDPFPAATFVIVAGQLDEVAPRIALPWLIAQTAVLGLVGLRYGGVAGSLAFAGAFGGFQLFAFVTAFLGARERRAREDLTRSHAELLATRALLAESSRNAERLRISRDLHDTVGHHLTALSLQLDVASRLSEGKAAEHVQQAHAITRLLLSDVRDVVSELRGPGRFDLAPSVRALVAGSFPVAMHLDLPDTLEIDEGARADALLKCVQEIVTNTTRHAAARNLWIAITSNTDGIMLHARDDGRGVKTIAPGNGLTGMRERFEALGGRIDFRAAEGQGFEVRGVMPKTGPVS